jgi:hypothetical protein
MGKRNYIGRGLVLVKTQVMAVPLTNNQLDLLTWIYREGYKNEDLSQVVWSARAYLGRPPTRSETSTLSKRIRALEEYDFIERDGRMLRLKNSASSVILEYVKKKPDDPEARLSAARLEWDRAQQIRQACITSTVSIFHSHNEEMIGWTGEIIS